MRNAWLHRLPVTYILKIEFFWGIHTILWNKKIVLKCFKCYSEKRLHNFGNRLEIGTTIIIRWNSFKIVDLKSSVFLILGKCKLMCFTIQRIWSIKVLETFILNKFVHFYGN